MQTFSHLKRLLIAQVSLIVVLPTLFLLLPRPVAAAIVGASFTFAGWAFVFWVSRWWQPSWRGIYWSALVFAMNSIVVYLMRLLYWGVPFEEITLAGIHVATLHRIGEGIYFVMIGFTIRELVQTRRKSMQTI